MPGQECSVADDELPVPTRIRRKVLNLFMFSGPGRVAVQRFSPLLLRLYNITVNNSLAGDVNGERWLLSRLRAPRVLIDVGFHRGEWSREVIERFPAALIYAFDPWPRARRFFEECAFDGDVEFFDLALSNAEGSFRFYDYDDACNSLALRDLESSPLKRAYDVNVTTLDNWCSRRDVDHVDLLKIDVEGYDLAVLEGARRLLDAQAIDVFVFEYASGWVGSRRFLGEADRYVNERGYSLYKLFPTFLAPFAYRIQHETFAGAMFVGLSPRALASGEFPIKHVAGL
jgi:FkbM family methyltransferase